MSDPYQLQTPENVVVNYSLAGVGSRFLATAIDLLIQGVLISLIVLALSAAGAVAMVSGALRDTVEQQLGSAAVWIVAVLLLVNFLVLWGYYVAFELLWNGQTPGKRAVGLRVLRDTGYPVGFFDSLIRNLVRIVDFLPVYYGVGVVSMLVDGRWRRLGDLAAGTIVVKLHGDLRAADLLADAPPPQSPDMDLSSPAVQRLGADEYALIREYLLRRDRLAPAARLALARELSDVLAARVGADVLLDDGAERFLEGLAAAYRAERAPLG